MWPRSSSRRVTTLPYGPERDQVVDVSAPPADRPAPVAVLLHGGFWRAAYDRHHLDPVADALHAQGYAVANVEYRRVGDGGGWPATFEDVAAALDAVAPMLTDRFGDAVDTGRTAYVGHSAGGHLALWAAVRDRLPSASPGVTTTLPVVRGVVGLAPVADLAEAHRLGAGRGAGADLLGGPPDEHADRWAAADPGALPPPRATTVLVHGTADDLVPVELSRRYAARTGAGLVELPRRGHFEVVDPRSTAWPDVLAALRSVL